VFAVGETRMEPEVAPPVAKPVPSQETAFEEDQVRRVEPPAETEVGLADKDAVGAASDTVIALLAYAVPPPPVQEIE
jgi:hypothetical protein